MTYRDNAKPLTATEEAKQHLDKLRRLGDLYARRPVAMKDFAEVVASVIEMNLHLKDEVEELKNRIEVLETWRAARVQEKTVSLDLGSDYDDGLVDG